MANVSVYNMEGSEVGKLDLNDSVFAVDVNEHLMHMAVVLQLANKRQGTQKAKTRSEVSGGGRKPWRQKGTGHARQGSTRSALVVLDGEDNDNVEVSARNIAGVRTVYSNAINVYDILKYDTIIITKSAVAKIEEVYA